MSESANPLTPFLEMFPCCTGLADLCGGLSAATVQSVVVSRESMSMKIAVRFTRMPAPAETAALERTIAGHYRMQAVTLDADWPRAAAPAPAKKKSSSGGGSKKSAPIGEILMGKPIKGTPVTMDTLEMNSGSVIVQGEVFSIENREIQKTGAAVLSFCMTDGTSSVHVSKYIRANDDQAILGLIKKGMYLTVAGDMSYNRYDEDIVLEPKSIAKSKKAVRIDTAEGEKRVELHLHTKFSNMDALTDTVEAINRAEMWGHRAIALTDHGVVQAFPDAWFAAMKKDIKILYGLEGYLVNDIDDRLAVIRPNDYDLNGEFVAFDIETTGLSAEHDRMTEIGAVIFRGSEIVDKFNIFVNPGMPIPPEITRLTSITDQDVADAPNPDEAMRQFLAFAGDRPLIAHNADFDVGFMTKAAQRAGIPFEPVYLDTLVIAQGLLNHLKKHKLDIVARSLSLPEFNHHRASDDAITVAHMMARFIPDLHNRGAKTIADIDPIVRELKNSVKGNRRTRHIILLVKTQKGLKNLYELVSQSHLDHFYKVPTIPKSLLNKYREGLIVGSACEAGELFDAMVRRRSDAELARIASYYDYLEIQPICNNRFMIAKGLAADDEELREYNRRIVRLGEQLGKPVVATGDVHFLDPEQEVYRHILLAAKKFDDADKDLPIYFKTTDEMLEEFAYLGPEKCREVVITNPNAIADSCERIILLPKDLFTPKIENSVEDLQNLVYGRMHELYGENPPEIVKSRVETELNDILGRHYDVIYMSAQKLVANSLEHGYLVGSRGSVGSSIVAYMSGITEVNALPPHYRCPKCKNSEFNTTGEYGCGADMPDKLCPVCGTPYMKEGFDIPFETFLGFGGDKVPDIDLNFSGEYQGNAHKYTEELFGRDHVFKAGTIGTLAEKTAFGFVKKYLEERGRTVPKAEENRLTAGCVGVKRTTGQHPGGLVIIPQDMDVTDFCPVQHPADDPNSDIITTHFDYHKMEANLLKLDELGHDDPTMIRMLEDLTGVNAREIRLDDPETMLIFKSPAPLGLADDDPIIGKTGSIGIPEFGTAFTRQMLVDTQPDAFDTLVRLSGFSHGTDVWLGNAKDLITSGTASVKQTVGCRDDIMLYLISKGMDPKMAFKIMEAVRKGKVKKGGFQEGWEEKMHELEVPQWYIDSLAKIAYLFPKAHAVAYVMMAFRIAWFKVHRPIAYYSAYFYRRGDSFDAAVMAQGIDGVKAKIREIKQNPKPTAKDEDTYTTLEAVYEFYMRGFTFANVDLYESDAKKFLVVDDKTLRPPFVAISGLGETAANDLVSCRAGGQQFLSIEELSAACPKVSSTHLEQLKAIGALGDLPESSQMSLF